MNSYLPKKKFSEVVDDFLKFIKNKRLIIHNSEFDIAHINHELSILGLGQLKNEVIDTLNLARNKFPGASVSLDALCKRYRIDNSIRTKHTALIDCDLLAKVYINLIDQKEPTLNFENLNYEKEENSKLTSYFKKVVKLSDIEKKNHKEYLSKFLKKNFF